MEFTKKIIASTEEIFNTMIFLNISSAGALPEGKQILGCHLSSMIGLSGDISAMLSIHCPGAISLDIAGAMLGMEIEVIDADVKDALGEIANMVAGGVKEQFASENINLELAIPATISGKSYNVPSPTRGNRVIIPFNLEQGQFFVEITYNLS